MTTQRLAARRASAALAVSLTLGAATVVHGWGAQGHRLVALLAAESLTPVARQNVEWLIAPETMADVASWADQYLQGNTQTALWHYVNVPIDRTAYDRDRDCPRQPNVAAGSFNDRWRDCVVDRIEYSRQRLADAKLDRADRAVALKFLVHFVGDLHQPFHAVNVEQGGNGIPVSVFGSDVCGTDPARPLPCNLHSVWDSQLIAHRALSDAKYVDVLRELIARERLRELPAGTPAEWAEQSLAIAKTALLPPHGAADEAYYRTHIVTIDRRLALAGIRLAALLNGSLTAAPPR